MTKPIYVLNGPNLNRLGTREPAIYGTTTLTAIEGICREEAANVSVDFRQSNSEAELIDWVHEAIGAASALVINPAAYSFTSIALLDALKMFEGPIVEVHISNIHRREEIYQRSLISKAATAVIAGMGADGYRHAIRFAIDRINNNRLAAKNKESGGPRDNP
jgi:3-dehydroquinate dehydratase-2